jgi:hypothetical protein
MLSRKAGSLIVATITIPSMTGRRRRQHLLMIASILGLGSTLVLAAAPTGAAAAAWSRVTAICSLTGAEVNP